MALENRYFIYDKERKTTALSLIREMFFRMQGVLFGCLVKIRHPYYVPKKYNVSICAIFKDEGQYLKEWIEYHILIGVEHFYLYNNNSSDNYNVVLHDYIIDGSVTLIDWPYNQAQMEAYRDCIEKYRSESNWIGFIDIDEFVVPRKQNTITELLDDYRIYPAVLLYWRLFGSSGKIDRKRDGLVTEDFTVCWNKYDEVGKCFYNTSYEFDAGFKRNQSLHHYMWPKYKGLYYPPYNIDKIAVPRKHINKLKSDDIIAQINHYFTKTYNEYLEKKSKGDVFFKINPHDEEYFYRHEMKCTSVDFSIYRFLIKLKIRLGK